MQEQTQGSPDGGYDLSQFHQAFFEEAHEHLAQMENLLVGLNIEAPSAEELNAVFRAMHSIKGGAGMFGFTEVTEFTHRVETLLDKVRNRKVALTQALVDTLLQSSDTVKQQLHALHGGGEGPGRIDELVARVEALTREEVAPAPAASAGSPGSGRRLAVAFATPDNDKTDALLGYLRRELGKVGSLSDEKTTRHADGTRHVSLALDSECSDEDLLEILAFSVDTATLTIEAMAPAAEAVVTKENEAYGFFDDTFDARRAGVVAVAAAATPVPPANGPAAPAAPGAAAAKAVKSGRIEKKGGDDRAAAESSIRVGVEKVDQLINMIGELVITQAMLAQAVTKLDPMSNAPLFTGIAQLDRITRDLQQTVMAVRMLPIAVVFNRFPRVVRDIAARLGKQVELRTRGEQTELDKSVIELIADPLTHLVRNSLDHGIESPEGRRVAGKPEKGVVELAASHRGGNIVIEVTDDGGGLDRDRILAKAREKGIAIGEAPTDQEVFQLIFEPGFSTAAVVTEVSGRGVGMDVVRKNINALGGRIDIESRFGEGSTIRINLPLTLAILDGMSIQVAGHNFILPLTNVIELMRVGESDVKSVAGGTNVVEVRGEYLPMISLRRLFNSGDAGQHATERLLVIVEAEGARAALLVDTLLGQHQVVIKSLESNYRRIRGFSGATIMGDGRVALILDVPALIRNSRQ